MKRIIISIAVCCIFTITSTAAPQLPGNCTASMPKLRLKPTIKEADVNELVSSNNWGQNQKAEKYWTVYSDRSHNITYNAASTSSGKCDELDFNQAVRIAKIEGDFALVYEEKKEGVIYPVVSNAAVSKGWIPMKNLLLWNSCPTDDAGIYNKALIVLNLDGKNSSDLGRRYSNPESKDNAKKLVSDMQFYFVMKKADNGLVLLAKECKMEGWSNQVLYGWVNTNSFVPWSQRTCIEPNWKPDVAEELKGMKVNVYRDGKKATDIMMGRENGITNNPTTKYRFEPQLMRYPLLENKSGNESQFYVTAFARPDGTSSVPTVPVGSDNSAAGVIDERLKEMSIINLIVVIDGTRSMESFYQPTQKIIQNAYEYFGKENKTVKVGVVIYRDYTDGQYVTEHLTMRSPTDPSVSKFLATGGNYGVKSSSSDRTLAEALFKGLEVALDANKMGYSSQQSNLMFVIGDCGNDLDDDKCLSQEDIIKRCVDNRVQVCAFQVRNENEQSFLLFRKQMGAIVRSNCKGQYKDGAGSNGRFKELADGYDFESGLPENRNFFIGSMRNAKLGNAMDISKLYNLIEHSYLQFNNAIKAQTDFTYNAGDIIQETEEAGSSTTNTMDMALLGTIFTKAQIAEIKKNNSLMAFQGYTDKVDSNQNLEYWQPIIYISSDEFQQLMEKLQPVMTAAGTGNRKPYVEAMKELTRSMIPDITPTEMDNKDVKEIMALVAGLNVKTGSLGGRTLAEIQSEEKVTQDEFDSMIANFQTKYNKLKKIRDNKYDFSVVRNKTTWYWIPVEDLP